MAQRLLFILFTLALFTIAGCSNEGETITVSSNSIDAEEVLTSDPDADIFQFDGVIYKADIDWVEELSLTKDIQIGKIKTRNGIARDFNDEMSNKLPVGAKIFSAKEREDILLIEVSEKTLKYLAMHEG